MTTPLESLKFASPQDLKNDLAVRTKDVKGIKRLELLIEGDLLGDARSFGELLAGLRRQGVRISHNVSIQLDFPGEISRQKTLELVERLPKSRNGSLKVRIEESR